MLAPLLLLATSHALYFDFARSDVICFRHKAATDADIQLLYTVNTPDLYSAGSPAANQKNNPASLKIYDIYDGMVFDTELTDRGELLFSPSQVGDYKICIGAARTDRSVGRMSLSITNHIPNKDTKDAKRRQEEQTITRLLAKAKAIDQQADIIHTNFNRFESQVSSTKRAIVLTNLICIAMYIIITTWQIKGLKRYFARRKI